MCLAGLLGLGSSSFALGAVVVFSDNFDDGDVTDWTKTTNYGGPTFVTADTTEFVLPSYSLETYLEPGPSGSDLYVRASHDFSAPVASDYSLNLWARSRDCSGCVISYDVLVDGVLLDRVNQEVDFEQRSFLLSGLAPGTHTLSLGMYTTNASSGRFYAKFDDVVISQVPLPAAAWLFISALGGLVVAKRKQLEA